MPEEVIMRDYLAIPFFKLGGINTMDVSALWKEEQEKTTPMITPTAISNKEVQNNHQK